MKDLKEFELKYRYFRIKPEIINKVINIINIIKYNEKDIINFLEDELKIFSIERIEDAIGFYRIPSNLQFNKSNL